MTRRQDALLRRCITRPAALALALAAFGARPALPAPDLVLEPLALPGGASTLPLEGALSDPDAPSNVSAVVTIEVQGRTFLVAAVDEGTELAVVSLDREQPARVVDLQALLSDEALDALGGTTDEIDLEGMAFDGERLWVTGSCAIKRKKPDRGDRRENLRRLLTLEPLSGGEPGEWREHSDQLYALEPGLEGGELTLALVGRIPVRRQLARDPLLKRFLAIPSKENGLDIEGLAIRGEHAYLGLRGPVLRGHAVVLRAVPDLRGDEIELDDVRPSFLHLEGRGLRSLDHLEDSPWGPGFFLVAGRSMSGTGDFHLYRWDGESDAFMGPGEGLEHLGRLPVPDPAWKVEGLFRLGDEVCVAFDGPPGGRPHRIRRP